MKHCILFCMLIMASVSPLVSAASNPLETPSKKSRLSRLLGKGRKNLTDGLWLTEKPTRTPKTLGQRTVSFVEKHEPVGQMIRSESSPAPVSTLLEAHVQPFFPAPLGSKFLEHLFCACYHLLLVQLSKIEDLNIENTQPFRLKLYTECLAVIERVEPLKPLSERIRNQVDSMRMSLAGVFYSYVLEDLCSNKPLPPKQNDQFLDAFGEIMNLTTLSENLPLKPL